VIVVDELAASTFWPGQDSLHKRVAFEYRGVSVADPQPIWREVVGVVRRVRHYNLIATPSRQGVEAPSNYPPQKDRGFRAGGRLDAELQVEPYHQECSRGRQNNLHWLAGHCRSGRVRFV